MESLYLNKIKIDLLPKPITRNIQIAEVGNVSVRKSSFSYTINIPRTSLNIQVLEMLGVIGNQSKKPFELIVADYVVDGIFLVSNGIAIIKKTSKDFSLNIIDGYKSLTDALAGKKLVDLDLTDLSHEISTQGYVDSFSSTEGYIYAVGDFGIGHGQGSIVKVEQQAPCLFTHTLVSRIFDEAGITVTGDFFTTNTQFLNEVITPVKGYTVIEEDITTAPKGIVDSSLADASTPATETPISADFVLVGTSLVGSSIVSGELVFTVAGEYGFNIGGTYDNTNNNLTIEIKVNSIIAYTIILSEGSGLTIDSDIVVQIEAADVVSFHVVGSSLTGGGSYDIDIDSDIELRTGGQTIDIIDSLGDMNQVDLLTDISNRYGLIIHPVQESDNYRFEQIENVLNYRSTAEDWTSKFASITSESYASGYAKINKAVYQYAEEIVVPNNDGEMLIDDAKAETEKEIISSLFEIPVVSESISTENIYRFPIWETDEDTGLAENIETPFKVMFINRADVPITAKLFEATTGISVSVDVPFLGLENMSMQYFLDTYYNRFKNLIENYKAVDFMLNLSTIDIYNLDFFKLKYMKQTGRFYYLNSVQNTAGKVSKVTMLEISEF